MSTIEFVRDEIKILEENLENLKDAKEVLESLRKSGTNVTKELLDNDRAITDNMKLQKNLVDALTRMAQRRQDADIP